MPIPKNLTYDNIVKALQYIDEHDVPPQNESNNYTLVLENGKNYPPKYVIAVADHLANGNAISTRDFISTEAVRVLRNLGFTVADSNEAFVLTITKDDFIPSDDKYFDINDLTLGNDYMPIDMYMRKTNGDIIRRKRDKNEKSNTKQTIARIMCQQFEAQLDGLSEEDKRDFPICIYKPNTFFYKGIFPSQAEFRNYHKTIEFCDHPYGNGKNFVFYCWNIFSTIYFVQECLKRFGDDGDKVVLIYREKTEEEKKKKKKSNPNDETAAQQDPIQQDQTQTPQSPIVYKHDYSYTLLKSKNIIFHGAPGTGKSFLAKQIAADIISGGLIDNYSQLNDEQKKQVEFVQFHPSYDYSDFVEGLRPKINDDGTMGFELRDGIFKDFVTRARKNLEDADKPITAIEKTLSVQESIEDFLEDVRLGVDTYKTINNNEFTITGFNDKHIYVSIPSNANINKLCLILDDIRAMLESDEQFGKIKDITKFFRKNNNLQAYSYYFAIYHEIKKRQSSTSTITATQEKPKNYIFIIDEINRGEISKIFGEFFFAVDPGYRGQAGEVSTQYANLHSDPNEKFYIPENVYIIGTMNDIDKSVDSFDFAMRRRFRFIEIKADKQLGMLKTLDDTIKAEAIKRMSALNEEIAKVEELGENYQIGAAYFLKLKENGLDFDGLWTDYLQPLLQEYIRGMYDDKSIMKKFKKAYDNKTTVGNTNEDNQD